MENSGHWTSRFRIEQLLEVSCPNCSARPGQWCDRSADKLSRQGMAQFKAGMPPSHQERMWTRQGHAEHEFPGLLARQCPGWDEMTPGKPAGWRAASHGACGACGRERAIRAGGGLPGFPVEFGCLHPGPGPVPGFPLRYAGERFCAECGWLATVEVVVQGSRMIGYRCEQGHMWLAGKCKR